MAHDFKAFPELTNEQMTFYYFQSPHKQITQDFRARVVEVHDGDTIKVMWEERDFPFKIRFDGVAAPELSEPGGIESREWLRRKIENKEVDVLINPRNRVGKWGRLIGTIMFDGININEEIIREGYAIPFNQLRKPFRFKKIEEILKEFEIK